MTNNATTSDNSQPSLVTDITSIATTEEKRQRLFWLGVRAGLLQIAKTIEKVYLDDSTKRK